MYIPDIHKSDINNERETTNISIEIYNSIINFFSVMITIYIYVAY
jgi:hypothetical protein